MRLYALVLLTATLLSLLGCSFQPKFVSIAEREGITVAHPEVAQGIVTRMCANMDAGRGPLLHAIPNEYLNVALSTNDRRLLELGVYNECPLNTVHYDAIWAGIDNATTSVEGYIRNSPNYNVGPDGFCIGTPCGSNGKIPDVNGKPYTP